MTSTILSVLGGFLALLLGAVKDFGGYSDGAVTAIGVTLLALGVGKEWISMRRDLAPARARRALSVCVFVPTHLVAERVADAKELVAQLRALGFTGATLRAGLQPIPPDTRAVVVCQPSEDEAPVAVAAAPEGARVLILKHGYLKSVQLSETVTCANSVMRLVLDLGAVAELEAK